MLRLQYKFSFVIVFVLLVSACNRQTKIPFNKNSWQASDSLRYQMLDDLLQSRILMNIKPDEIKSILGEPDYRWDSLERWSYSAGAAPEGFGVSFYSLVIKFRNGLVDSTIAGKYHD